MDNNRFLPVYIASPLDTLQKCSKALSTLQVLQKPVEGQKLQILQHSFHSLYSPIHYQFDELSKKIQGWILFCKAYW